jgi:hypothetical protein
MDLINSQQSSQKSEKKALMLSGSEFDELDAQLEEIIMEEGEDINENIILTPTDAVLLSQHHDILN